MPQVDYVLPELAALLPQYEKISDCLSGEMAVKKQGTKYLPMPMPHDQSPQNLARYQSYLTRAVFYNVAQRTLNGLVGQIFLRDPNAKVPALLDTLLADVNGGGVTLTQQAKGASNIVLSKGRAGLYVDYPETNGATATIADVQSGNIRPTIGLYQPENIINWRTKARGAKQVLSLVVLVETYVEEDDGFEPKTGIQWRVLRLDKDDKYVIELYRETDKAEPFKQYLPLDAKGNTLNEIPFIFIGVEKNDPTINLPPMYDICSLNIAHYRNSADFEETAFICGQATPVISGLTEEWAKNVLGGKVELGSRAAVMLPENGKFELVQAQETNIHLSGMEQKEKQMVALGAKLVENKSVQRTATEASQDEAAESSVLSATAKNVGAAYKWALEWAAILVGLADPTKPQGERGGVEFDLNTEFDLQNLSPEERKALLSEWTAGGITTEEYRDNLLRAGIATLTFEEFQAQAAIEQAADLARMAAETKAQMPPDPANPNPPPPAA